MSSMNPWTLLGLDDDADERAIKRQYAKLLKITRPDDDPEGFQRLREAYERALSWARNRADDEDDFSTPTTTVERLSDAFAGAAPVAKQPIPGDTFIIDRAAPDRIAESIVHQTARELLEQTTAQNLQQQHQNAVTQNCDLLFQQCLLERCLEGDPSDLDLLTVAVIHLRWLTPWQSMRISADHEVQLTHMLLENESARLEQMLADDQEPAFLAALEQLAQRPWLAALERRDQFQRWAMFFLHNHKGWTAALFDRVCTLFGWDDGKGVFPEPEFIWRHLIERCEKYAYIEHLQKLINNANTDNAEGKAARMVLNPGRKVERLRLARFFGADDWIACERLCSTLKNRYPDVVAEFLNADLESWRSLQVAPMIPALWTWFGWLLFSLFFMVPDAIMSGKKLDGIGATFILLIFPLTAAVVCRLLAGIWAHVVKVLQTTDEWLSDRLLPEWLHWPASQALLLRHGTPLILVGATVSLQGPAALLCYTLLMLAWIFLSPYRHPQIYAPAREAIKTFLHFNQGKILLSVAVIAASIILVSIYPPQRHDLRIPNAGQTASAASTLDCSSDQAMELMDKECKNSLMPERCAKNTREQKISQCWRIRARLQGSLDGQHATHP